MKFLSDILAKAGLTVDGVVTLNNTATGQTPDANDNSTKLATTAWVRTFVQPYSLPIASASVLGGIKVGSGLSINSGTGVLSVTGASAASIKSTQTFIVTEGQTVYTVTGGYTPGLMDIFVNGVYLSPNQTTATNGTTFTINDPAATGDIVDIIVSSPIFEGSASTTDQLPEGVVNLYYTNARARAAITLTTTGVSGAATYNSSTGVFNIPNYQGLVPAGGVAGDILAKVSGTNYDVTWIPNYTSQVQHIVKAAVAVTKGQAVYVSSADGTNMIVSKASNASEQTSSKTLGLVAQDLAINGQGFVVTEGLLAGLNTSTANAGDPVWLGTDGNLIFGLLNKPTAPAHLVFIGVVTRVQQNNGEIFVKVQNGFELDELHDLSVKNASDGDMIKYVASTGLWTKIAATTTNITEGTNLYYTQGRFDTAFSAKSTSNLTEGTNLYYTDTRVGTYLTANSYATQSYVSTQINNLVSGAPGLLDTLDELAAALGDDPNFATTVSTALSNRLRIDIGTQGLTSTQQGYGRTNLGLGSLATLSSVANAQITDVAYSKLTGVPSTFAPSAHTHPISDITGLQTALDGKQASLSGTGFVKISGTTISYDNSTYYLASNPSGYITSSALSSYLPLSGGTVTGKTNIGTGGSTNGGIFNVTGGTDNQMNISHNSSWGLLLGYCNESSPTGYHGPNHAAIINVQDAPLHLGSNNSSVLRIVSTGASILGNTIIHAGNYNSYALPLSGGTMSGSIIMSGTQQIKHAGFSGIEYYNGTAQWQGYIGTENNTGNLRYNSFNGAHSWYANSSQIMTLNSSGTLTTEGNIYITNNGGRLYFDRLNGATVGAIGWHSNDVFYVAGHPDYGPGAGNHTRMYGFGGNLYLGNATNGDVVTIDGTSGNITMSKLTYFYAGLRLPDLDGGVDSMWGIYGWGSQLQFTKRSLSGDGFGGVAMYIDYGGLYVQSDYSFRAPIFYDSNDPNYFIDPNSESKLYRLNVGGGSHTLENNQAVVKFRNTVDNHNYIVSEGAGWGSWHQWIRYVGSYNTWRIGTFDAGQESGESMWRLAGKNRGSNAEVNYIVAGPRGSWGSNDRVILWNPYARYDGGSYNGDGTHYKILDASNYTSYYSFTNLTTNRIQVGNYAERSFDLGYFTNGVSNWVSYINLGNIQNSGYLEVEVASTYSYQSSVGLLRKIIPFGTNANGSYWYSGDSKVQEANGSIADNIYIGDLEWDGSNFRLPIYHVVNSGNGFVARIKWFNSPGGNYEILSNATVSSSIRTAPANWTNNPAFNRAIDTRNIRMFNNDIIGWRYSSGDSNMYNHIYSSYDDTTTGITYRSGQWTGSQGIVCHRFQTYSGSWQNRLVIYQDGVTHITSGSKIVVQNSTDGSSSRGIFMWNSSDPNWGIYMAQSGAGKALNDGTAPAGLDGRTEHAIRFRVANTTGQIGFLWENSDNVALMQLQPNTGTLLVRNRIVLGVFPNSTGNNGEAWIGRAADRNQGTMTVQLGGGSASNREFEVVDYAWSVVLFRVGSNGNVTASGDITAYSDRRIKENIKTIDNAVQKVKAIRGVTFTRNDMTDSITRHAGVIAQEILQVLPEVVTKDANDHYSVAYGNLNALLIEAIKEQQKQIEELQNKLDNVLSSR